MQQAHSRCVVRGPLYDDCRKSNVNAVYLHTRVAITVKLLRSLPKELESAR